MRGVRCALRAGAARAAPRPAVCASLSAGARRLQPPPFGVLASATTTPQRLRARLRGCAVSGRRQFSVSAPALAEASLRKTPLYDLHLAHGAKMVPFGGFHMPVQYASRSVKASHIFTRTKASLFDVSHMVQRHVSGPGAAAFLKTVTPSNTDNLAVHHSTLSALLWKDTGGICDDTVITRLGPELFYVVTNAACRDKDDEFFRSEMAAHQHALKAVHHEELAGWGLLALQGPLSRDILHEVLADKEVDLPSLFFGSSLFARIWLRDGELSEPLLISRGGYTGEDGFEISVPPQETVAVAETLLEAGTPDRLQLAGLGARDSLRLEAGMCLYGHDLDDTTTPVEAGLSWIIPKERRDDRSFNGAGVVLQQIKPKSKGGSGVERRRVGLVVSGAPAREGAQIVSADGDVLGAVTSGCPSPTLGKNIAMGYVKDGFHKAGTALGVLVRGKRRDAVVVKMPFVETKYWKGTPAA